MDFAIDACYKTVLVFINKCGLLYNDLASRLLCMIKNESDKKSDVLDIFSKKLIGFLMKGKYVSIRFEMQRCKIHRYVAAPQLYKYAFVRLSIYKWCKRMTTTVIWLKAEIILSIIIVKLRLFACII